ncbi:hypothetical protein P8C59_007715 [Phyllachora maydis]|uniref:Carotenoid oxygenase n=1 Tax=Phyllachora maydis TaxID=1825666 RepID=A0AAD9IA98_9PEZI|nr:hypothetical protein P8C59_007715 [Phyllachora maydis]
MLEQGAIVDLDLDRGHPYLSGNFAPIDTTLPLTPCAYTGTIPPDLAGGQYVRNGGNPVAHHDLRRDAHWFDGDGMLSGVLFRRVRDDKGRPAIQPEFVNQFLVTDVYTLARTSRVLRRPVLPSIATLVSPATSMLVLLCTVVRTVVLFLLSRLPGSPRTARKISVANTAVLYHDGRALATCESGVPLRFALPSLETIGWFNGRTAENEPARHDVPPHGFGGSGPLASMKEWTTAHPRVDPVTGELITFHSVFLAPYVYYSIVPPDPSTSAPSTRPPSTRTPSTSPPSTSPPTTKPAAQPKRHRRRRRRLLLLLPPAQQPAPAAPSAARFCLPVPGVSAPKMMHDFGVSRLHTVILDLPLTLDPRNPLRGAPVLRYDAAGRSRFGVFPRHAPHRVTWFETAACCIFHTANCWDTPAAPGPATVVHLLACRLTSASLIFSAGNLPTPAAVPVPPAYAESEQCRLYYYAFPLAPPTGGRPPAIRHQWALAAIPFEFPTVAPRAAMGAARFVYGCSTRAASYGVALGKAAKVEFLAKVDARALVARGTRRPPEAVRGVVDARTARAILDSRDPDDPIRLFEMPPGWYAQEPRFVPRRGARHEDDGWLVTYVFDEAQLDARGACGAAARSELWVLDARGMRDVVARVRLPQRVPYGLHGTWYSEGDVQGQRPWEAVRPEPSAGVEPGGDGFWDAVRDMVERWVG